MKKLLGCLTALTIAFGASSASAMVFGFTQDGFDGGGAIIGSFTADDLDSNGQISFFSGEVTDFSVSFSGDGFVSDFTLDFVDLFGLVYDLDGDIGDGLILDVEGIGATSLLFDYSTGPGPVALCDGIAVCGVVTEIGTGATSGTTELVLVDDLTAVPLPAALPLFASGLGVLGFMGWRRKKAAKT